MMSKQTKILLGIAIGVSATAFTFTYYDIFYKPTVHITQMLNRISKDQTKLSSTRPNFSLLPPTIKDLAQYVYSLGGYTFPTSSQYAQDSNLEDLTQYLLGYDIYQTAGSGGVSASSLSSNAKAIENFLTNNLVQDTTPFNPQTAKTAIYAALSASVSVGDSINPSSNQMKAYQSMNQPGYVFHVVQQYTRMAVVHALINDVLRQETIISALENNLRTNQCQSLNIPNSTSTMSYSPDYNSSGGPLFYDPVTSRQDVQRGDLEAFIREYRRMECFKLYTMLAQAQLQVVSDESQIFSLANQYEQLNLQEKAAIGK